jgi:collagenase-like PrtC family protease
VKYFSVPADFKKETIDKYADLNRRYPQAKLVETYGNITVSNTFGSGRTVNLLPDVDLDKLADYVAYGRERDIDFNYTLNASFMGNREFQDRGITEIKIFLSKLYESGVRSLTVTLPSLVELIQSTSYDFVLKASTICSITNPDKAMAFKRMGMDRIVVDESINRDFASLKKIRECFGEKVEIIANVICYKNCIYRMFHYNEISGDSVGTPNRTSCEYFVNRCVLQRYQDIANLLKINWVRPEDLHYYTDIGICYFKLQGRQSVLKGDPARALEHYFKEDYDGDLMELLDMFDPMTKFRVPIENKKLDGFLEPYAKKPHFCSHYCPDCRYCEGFAKRSIDYKKAAEVVALANEFFRDYDLFNQAIKADDTGLEAKKLFSDDLKELDFEFEE